ncbi:phage tail length tape measure family protein [Brucella anthropi]|uniref:phage tail length tape measure family protein n=1 Tax=Brucella anthropi TaxID=529 RepID=UPI000F65FF71|nr:phage tail length tape measure family protein [Brucella anthropi]RRY09005.1 hypothetical protein EGJ58_14110 [Brucella anthropi]
MAGNSAYKLGIVISADAKEVKPAAAETRNELTSIGTAATSAETKMQKLISTANGLHAGAAGNQSSLSGALAAEGMALDELRAKYNPMFAVIRQYKAAQAEIRAAHSMGALSADELTAALQRQRQAALASIDALKGRNNAANNNHFAAQNAMFQVQDIGMTAAMGMDAKMIALQQGTQLAGGMAGMTMKQAGASLVSAFTMLLSPVSLAAVAVTGLTAAAIQYAIKWVGNAKDLNQTLKEHEEQIKRLHDAYQYAGTGADDYYNRINAGQRFLTFGSRRELQRTVKDETDDILNAVGYRSAYSFNKNDPWKGIYEQFRPFEDAIQHLRETAKKGEPDLLGFRQLVEDRWSVDENNKALSETAKKLLEMGKDAVSAAQLLAKSGSEAIRAGNAIEAARRRFGAYGEALAGMRGIAPLQLSDRRQLENDYAAARGNAGDRNERDDAYRQRQEALERINSEEQRQIELSQIDIQLQVARDPLTRAELTAQRERITLSGMEIDAAEAENRVRQARNQAMAEAIAQSFVQIADMQAEIAARRNITDAISAGTISAADAQIYLQAESELRPLIAAAAKAEGEEKQKLLTIINQMTVSYQQMAEEQKRAAAVEMFQGQKDEAEQLRLEVSLVGAGEVARRRALSALEAEQDLKRSGISVESELGQKYRDNAAHLTEMRLELEKQTDAWSRYQSAGESAIDTIFDGLSSGKFDFASIGKDLLSELTKTWLELDVKNPLKNALFGSNYGTMSDLLGGKKDGGGLLSSIMGQNISSMTVTAATVMVNGGVSGGVGGLFGLGAGAAANNNTLTGDIAAFGKVIRGMESSNNYSALGPVLASGDRAYGAYQVMGANVPNWTKSALGYSMTPDEFLKSSSAQDAVFNKVFGGYVGKYGASGAAQAWFGGPGSVGSGGNAADILGTTGTEYVNKFNAGLQQLSATTGSATGAISNLGSGLNTASTGLNQLGNGFNNFGQQLSGFASGGGGFSLSSLFPGAGGFQSKQLAGAIASGSWGLWDTGGYTGPGGVYEPRGIVHAGEVVWSQRDVARAGGVHVVEGMRLGYRGYDSGGVVGVTPLPAVAQSVANSNRQGNSQNGAPRSANFHFHLDGARGDKEIEDAAYRGMQMALTEYDNMLPDRVAGINQNPEWR